MDIRIDSTQLLALAPDTPEALVPIVEQFRENSAELISSMKEALSKSDTDSIAGYVHQLKGSAGTLGMVSLYESCLSLEKKSMEGINTETFDDMSHSLSVSVQLALSALAG